MSKPLFDKTGWQTRYIADPEVAELNPSYRLKQGSEYPFLPMDAVREQVKGIAGFARRVLDSGGYCVFKNGDIIFAKITPLHRERQNSLGGRDDRGTWFWLNRVYSYQSQNAR